MRIWVLLFLLSSSLTGFAEPLRIGVEKLNYLPYYQSNKGEYEGFARELFDAFARQYQHSLDYQILPTARLLSELLNHHIDFKFPDNPNWKKDRKQTHSILYSNAIVESIDGIIVHKENRVKPIDQIKKIAIMRGFTPWAIMDRVNDRSIVLIEVNSMDTLLKQVYHRRVDGAYVNIRVAQHFQPHDFNAKESLVFNAKLPHDKSHYYLSTIAQGEILKQFNQWMSTHKKLITQLKLKWNL